MLDYAWPAERTWHFLAGMVGQFAEPFRCNGTPIAYSRVPEFQNLSPRAAPGTLEADTPRSWRLWCRDGFVRLENEDAHGNVA